MDDSAAIYVKPATIMANKKKADYIGKTTRKFKQHLVEHITDIKLSRYKSDNSKRYQEKEVILYFK